MIPFCVIRGRGAPRYNGDAAHHGTTSFVYRRLFDRYTFGIEDELAKRPAAGEVCAHQVLGSKGIHAHPSTGKHALWR